MKFSNSFTILLTRAYSSYASFIEVGIIPVVIILLDVYCNLLSLEPVKDTLYF